MFTSGTACCVGIEQSSLRSVHRESESVAIASDALNKADFMKDKEKVNIVALP